MRVQSLKSLSYTMICIVICTIALLCCSFALSASLTESTAEAASTNTSNITAADAAGTASAGTTPETLTVGVPKDRCPVFYEDPDTGEIVGIGVDLMRAAAEEADYNAEFRFVEEDTLKEALDNTAYDVVMPFGSAIDSASGKPSIVTDNLIQTPFTLVTTGKRDLPPLNEMKVGMVSSLGGGAETVSQLYPGMEISMYDTMDDCVKALRAGEVDALLHNSYVWSYVLQKPTYGDLEVQPSTMFSMDFRAGTLDAKAGRILIGRLNEGIAKLNDTRCQAIVLAYTSKQLYQKTFSDYLHEYGLVLLLALLLLIALIIIATMKVRNLRREHEAKLRQMMDYDPMTGILSMNGFRRRVEELLHAHPDTPYYLTYNNIRDFKFINDSLGREAGDELLKFWARKSLANLSDEEAIGRIDADHFAVLRHIPGEEQMRADEKNVILPLRNFFIDQGKDHRVQMCSGIYVLTAKDFRNIDVDHMLDLARVAEKRVRDSRTVDYAFYNPEQWEKGKLIADVINFLPAAIREGDLYIWYQPQVNYETGEMIGAEALCRWDHDKLGMLYPLDFIDILEESGLIYDLDCYVWDRVCQDLARWNAQGVRRSVSVNVSRCDIQEDRDIPGQFRDLVQKYGLTPDQLRAEITETAYVEKPELLISTTKQMKEYGFRVEMDDFGRGYSSLHMLKEVPVDRIKLDMHFLTDSGDPQKGRIIVSHIVQMINALGMKLIAEGVEKEEQAEFLRNQGCLDMQGFYFYRPMPVEDFEKITAQIPRSL